MKKTSDKKNKKNTGPNPQPPAVDFHVERILVPIDFSEHSKNALVYAASLAGSFHADLLLVYVVEPTLYPADFGFGQVALPAIEKEMRERGKAGLKKLIESDALLNVTARAVVRAGNPYLEIISLAREEHVDLIIIATHGHTGVEHLLFGSTAEKVVRKAPCPVLVVRPKG
jgi:nucleotide-binding universal stress UspA family protein